MNGRAQPRSLQGPVQAPPERRSSPAGDASLHRRAARLSRSRLKQPQQLGGSVHRKGHSLLFQT